MFVANLSAGQQGVLLALAKEIMISDGVVSQEETEMFEFLKNQCDPAASSISIEGENFYSIFTTTRSKVSLMLELISMAYSDNAYHEKESHLIKRTAASLSISPQLLEDMESWVKRQMILIKEAKIFMEN